MNWKANAPLRANSLANISMVLLDGLYKNFFTQLDASVTFSTHTHTRLSLSGARAAAALGFLGSLPTLLSSSMEFARCPWKCASRAMDPGGERQEGPPSSQPLLCSSTKTVNWQLFHCLKGLFWNSHFPSLLSHSEMTHEEQWVMQKHWAIAVWSCCLLYQPNVIILEYFDFLSDNNVVKLTINCSGCFMTLTKKRHQQN